MGLRSESSFHPNGGLWRIQSPHVTLAVPRLDSRAAVRVLEFGIREECVVLRPRRATAIWYGPSSDIAANGDADYVLEVVFGQCPGCPSYSSGRIFHGKFGSLR